MDDPLLDHRDESIANFREYMDSFSLEERAPLFDKSAEIFAVAVFLDNVVVVGGFHNIKKAHDVNVLERLQDAYFGQQSIFYVFVFVN